MAMVIEPVSLHEEIMDLSLVGKTIDGMGFAYTQLDCVGKNVGSIEVLSDYEYLRQIDLSQNCIDNVSAIAGLSHVLRLNLSANKIPTIDSWLSGGQAHLMHLDLSGNKLVALPALQMPALRTASFARNLIDTCASFTGHSTLELLDLSVNPLDSLIGVGNMPRLKSLNVSSNKLWSLAGLSGLPSLVDLDISSNAFESFSGPWSEMPKVETLSAQNNRVTKADGLEALFQVPSLKQLNVLGNPLADEDGVNIRHEVLIWQYKVQKIDGEEVTEDERGEAKALNEDRQEKERIRKEEEAEAKRLAEEEEAKRIAEEEEAKRLAEEEEAKNKALAENIENEVKEESPTDA